MKTLGERFGDFLVELTHIHKRPNIPHLRINPGKKSNHFGDRFEERGIDPKQVGTAFKRMMTERYCELLFIGLQSNISTGTDIGVRYKNTALLLTIRRGAVTGNIEIYPRTVLDFSRNHKPIIKDVDFVFTLN
jgi:hypothetical protein